MGGASSATAGGKLPQSGPQHHANDFSSQRLGFPLQSQLRCRLVVLDGHARLFYLGVGAFAGFDQCGRSRLEGLLAACFLPFEHRQAGFTQALFVLGGARFSRGDVGPGLLYRAFGFAATVGQHLRQRLVY